MQDTITKLKQTTVESLENVIRRLRSEQQSYEKYTSIHGKFEHEIGEIKAAIYLVKTT